MLVAEAICNELGHWSKIRGTPQIGTRLGVQIRSVTLSFFFFGVGWVLGQHETGIDGTSGLGTKTSGKLSKDIKNDNVCKAMRFCAKPSMKRISHLRSGTHRK